MINYGGATRAVVAYLSAEFLPGPHLANNLLNLGITEAAREAMRGLGYDLDEILAEEEEPGLGNGGLGPARVVLHGFARVGRGACSWLRHPLRVRHFRPGHPRRLAVSRSPTNGCSNGNPWEIARPEIAYRSEVWRAHRGVDGRAGPLSRALDSADGSAGRRLRHADRRLPRRARATSLRLWKAEAVESFDFAAFNHGDYDRAVEDKVASRDTSRRCSIPNDEAHRGKELRLKQQFFFTSCSLQDMLRIHALLGGTPATFHEKWAVQLNDTHPAVAVAELMRLLVDEHALGWDEAWTVTARDVRLHESHAAPRGAGEVDGRSLRLAAPAASRDRLRDQSPLPRRSARRISRRRRAARAALAHR